MQCPDIPTEDDPQIQCGWVGCNVQLDYDSTAISSHINMAHKEKLPETICRWEKPGGGICGKKMNFNHLRRHTLDIHTTLMVVWCEQCGMEQRKDVLGRHKMHCKELKET
jgi:hypothetical protein